MVGVTVRLFTDEHIDPRLAPALLRRGYDVLTCQAAGRANLSISDDDQLTFAASEGRAFLTFNTVDFIILDTRWKAEGRRHAGIVVSPLIGNLSDLVRRVELHLAVVSPAQQDDTLLWLKSSPG